MDNSFVALDFETATGYRNSACSIGIVTVDHGVITDEYCALIQPPDNYYWSQNIQVHGIRPNNTLNAPTFDQLFPQIYQRIAGRVVVAHNEVFDRSVMKGTMEFYRMNYYELRLSPKWECTCKIYRAKGFSPANLHACCSKLKISLNHHEALSDARGCAKLYLAHLESL